MRLYANIRNVADAHAPFDPVTYGGSGYNPSWAEAGVLGRYMEIAARLTF